MRSFRFLSIWLLVLTLGKPSFALERLDTMNDHQSLTDHLRMTELDNGIRVILAPNDENQVLAIKGFLDVGILYEPVELNGISNLTHQLLLKGTEQRSAGEIAEVIESVGGFIDVAVRHDYSEIAVMAAIDNADLALNLIAECLFHPTFPADQFEKERQFILSRIRIADDHPASFTDQRLYDEIYRGHAYGRPIQGEPETLNNIQRDDVLAFYCDNYQPARLTLIAMGNFDADDFERKIRLRFHEFSNRAANTMKVSKNFNQHYKMNRFERNSEQKYIRYGFPVCPAGNPDMPALRVAVAILGEGRASRLFMELRDKQGLTCQVEGRLLLRREASNVVFSINTKPENALRAINGISREIDRLQEEATSEEELNRTKNYIVAKSQIAHQSNMACVSILGDYDQLGLGVAYDQHFEEIIRRVSADDVRNVARKYLRTPVIIQVGSGVE